MRLLPVFALLLWLPAGMQAQAVADAARRPAARFAASTQPRVSLPAHAPAPPVADQQRAVVVVLAAAAAGGAIGYFGGRWLGGGILECDLESEYAECPISSLAAPVAWTAESILLPLSARLANGGGGRTAALLVTSFFLMGAGHLAAAAWGPDMRYLIPAAQAAAAVHELRGARQ